jgi:hypothetical protein
MLIISKILKFVIFNIYFLYFKKTIDLELTLSSIINMEL